MAYQVFNVGIGEPCGASSLDTSELVAAGSIGREALMAAFLRATGDGA